MPYEYVGFQRHQGFGQDVWGSDVCSAQVEPHILFGQLSDTGGGGLHACSSAGLTESWWHDNIVRRYGRKQRTSMPPARPPVDVMCRLS